MQGTTDTTTGTVSAQSARRAWRAYWYGIANGVLFTIGSSFVDSSTVLPTLVAAVTPSRIAIGLIPVIANSGWYLPQLLTAGYLRSSPFKRPLFVAGAAIRAASVLALIPCVQALGSSPAAALTAFFVLYAVYSMSAGLNAPPFLDIVAKTVPANKLGSFFGHRAFWGGIGSMGAGLLVRAILGSPSLHFPSQYTLLFLIASSVLIPGWIVFCLVDEPPGRVQPRAEPLLRFLWRAPTLVRADRRFSLLLTSSVLTSAVGIARPFYIVYATQVLKVPAGTVGSYIIVQMAGSVVLVPLWAYLNDRRGPKTLLLAANSLSLVATSAALGAALLPQSPTLGRLALMLVFLPLAGIGSGTFTGSTRYLFGIAPEEQRTLYIGIYNTLLAFTTFLPLLGGVLLNVSSFPLLFAVAMTLAAATVVASARLPHMAPDDSP